ncbi:TetR/AcrR family transcriptional regulator, partial [Christensenella hongkongensis]|uniref:TetR/AcrR family transcriptional regulator n=1 Tax=Christensenella hongkongensis TaxID=270498 RepID=UPI0039B8D7C8
MLIVLANGVRKNKRRLVMPKDKTETYHKIIRAAKAEFLEKGFEQASMRNVASAIGMSAAGLYRHFKD